MHSEAPSSAPSPASPARIRLATFDDLAAIGAIRNAAIAQSDALWTTVPESPQDIAASIGPLIEHRRVFVAASSSDDAEIENTAAGATVPSDTVLGYAYYMPLRAYNGYDATMEHSIYLSPEAQGMGLGTRLLETLIDRAHTDTVHSLVGNIAGNNAASIRLHEKLGFTTVGRIPEAGHKFDRWLDLIIMQYRL